MDCANYRRALLAEPGNAEAERLAHRLSCDACRSYTEQITRFESRLERALQVRPAAAGGPAPGRAGVAGAPSDGVVVPIHGRRSGRAFAERPFGSRRRWLAAAASVLLAMAISGGLWLAIPGSSLAADVVGHMADEPDAWARTSVPVPTSRLEDVLHASGLRLAGDAGLVSYASSCLFRGRQVPHLVLQTDAGPVTVMLLTHETTSRAVHFAEQGYRGMILPVAGHGSIAVLERGTAIDMTTEAAAAARVQAAIDWTA